MWTLYTKFKLTVAMWFRVRRTHRALDGHIMCGLQAEPHNNNKNITNTIQTGKTIQ